jgi:hypothetical protein
MRNSFPSGPLSDQSALNKQDFKAEGFNFPSGRILDSRQPNFQCSQETVTRGKFEALNPCLTGRQAKSQSKPEISNLKQEAQGYDFGFPTWDFELVSDFDSSISDLTRYFAAALILAKTSFE